MKMVFSKGKRIEDETSQHIVEIATNIGCSEGADAVTVTRICRELGSDRRVVYNRFRGIDEINSLVATKCNADLIAHARKAINPTDSYSVNFTTYIEAAFNYIYERESHFQYYIGQYQIDNNDVVNDFLGDLTELINAGKEVGNFKTDADSIETAKSIWLIIMGTSGMLATNADYKYKDGLNTMFYGVNAVSSFIKS
jgi:AcrR family transcriptional regulator